MKIDSFVLPLEIIAMVMPKEMVQQITLVQSLRKPTCVIQRTSDYFIHIPIGTLFINHSLNLRYRNVVKCQILRLTKCTFENF